MWWEMGREEETDKRTRGPRHECDTETLTAATSASSWEWWCKRKRHFQACVATLTGSLPLKCINNFITFLNTSTGPPSFSSLLHHSSWHPNCALNCILFAHYLSSRPIYILPPFSYPTPVQFWIVTDETGLIAARPLLFSLTLVKSLTYFVPLKYI